LTINCDFIYKAEQNLVLRRIFQGIPDSSSYLNSIRTIRSNHPAPHFIFLIAFKIQTTTVNRAVYSFLILSRTQHLAQQGQLEKQTRKFRRFAQYSHNRRLPANARRLAASEKGGCSFALLPAHLPASHRMAMPMTGVREKSTAPAMSMTGRGSAAKDKPAAMMAETRGRGGGVMEVDDAGSGINDVICG
jgi:hypothetical protein